VYSDVFAQVSVVQSYAQCHPETVDVQHQLKGRQVLSVQRLVQDVADGGTAFSLNFAASSMFFACRAILSQL
jgi:hypothetical protein